MTRPQAQRARSSAPRETVRLRVHVKPRASRSRVLGARDGVLEVSLAASPVDGEANRELLVTMAEYFDVPKSSVLLVSGASSRHKCVDLVGIDPDRLAACLRGETPR